MLSGTEWKTVCRFFEHHVKAFTDILMEVTGQP
jgi:hypothetical protein